jgi:hypothetical protein
MKRSLALLVLVPALFLSACSSSPEGSQSTGGLAGLDEYLADEPTFTDTEISFNEEFARVTVAGVSFGLPGGYDATQQGLQIGAPPTPVWPTISSREIHVTTNDQKTLLGTVGVVVFSQVDLATDKATELLDAVAGYNQSSAQPEVLRETRTGLGRTCVFQLLNEPINEFGPQRGVVLVSSDTQGHASFGINASGASDTTPPFRELMEDIVTQLCGPTK